MSIRCSFMDNTVYGADDINFALSRLTTQGISLFGYSDEDNPLLSLNNAVASLTESGVELYNTSACKVSYDSANNTFSILPGTAFMFDGSFISIDSEPYDITQSITEIRKSSENVITVYLYRNTPSNTIEIKLTDDSTQIDSEKSVILAEISNNNKILDKRTFAKSKIAPASSNIISTFQFSGCNPLAIHTGKQRLRATYTQIFEGAKYCFFAGEILEIQRIQTEDGTGLEFKQCVKAADDNRCYVAFNLINGSLYLWIYTPAANIHVYSSDIYVF